MVETFLTDGFVTFAADPDIADWAGHARIAGIKAASSPDLAKWLVCGGTWFVGVDALPNDEYGRIGESGPIKGQAINVVERLYGHVPQLHCAQVSVTYPGYPKPREGEGSAAFRYRLNRDAAHVDGVRAVGPDRRRVIDEPHAWILGTALSDASPDAAPLVVWKGSHIIMRDALQRAVAARDPANWHKVDVTESYQAARREVFETCARIELPLQPGQAVLLHRLVLHGVAPWADGASAAPEGRMIAYFRPHMEGGVPAWLGKN